MYGRRETDGELGLANMLLGISKTEVADPPASTKAAVLHARFRKYYQHVSL
jgi:hypothetical protein